MSDLTVGKLVDYLVVNNIAALKTYDEAWSRNQVRDVVRAILKEQLAVSQFSDKADFVHDLGME